MKDHVLGQLLDPDTALEYLLSDIETLDERESTSLNRARGRICAETVTAPLNLPPFPASAMDGLAVCLDDDIFTSPPPWRLPLQGVSLAGRPYAEKLRSNNALRIFTGAVIPDGADTVVIQENTLLESDHVLILELPERGANIRPPGHDVKLGETLIEKGKEVNAFDIGWLAASGIDRLQVTRKVRVSLFSTGDELIEAGSELEPGQIYESNRIMLKELFGELPMEIQDLGILPDNLGRIKEVLTRSSRVSDVLLTSGGVSVGDADYVRTALEDLGSLSFWKLAIKPGKPLAYGKIGSSLFFGLPGNPVSSIVTFLLFVIPSLRRLAGCSEYHSVQFPATLAASVHHTIGRVEYQRGIYRFEEGQIKVRATGDQGSNRIGSFSNSNCLIRIRSDQGDLTPGASVVILPFRGILP